jgi:lysophospholipase L1-like esterase
MRFLSNITFLIAVLATAAGCGGNATPFQPPPPDPKLEMSCPAPIVRDATTSQGTDVHFDAPAPTGGRAPYSVQCNPGSGTVFAIGETPVLCTATDANMAQASCGFGVTVRVSQTIAKTKFMAFGDSITEGQVSPAATFTIVEPIESYPHKLEEMLRARYLGQDVTVINSGFGGETAPRGLIRLPGVLDSEHPDVLLLQEGTNGLLPSNVAGREDSLRGMVAMARQRNIDVVIANLLPVGPPHTDSRPTKPAAVVELNRRIDAISIEFGIGTPIDLYSIFAARPDLIGMDGLHPTRDGYTRIAEAFRDEIARRYSRNTSTSLRLSPPPFAFSAMRRSR